MPKIENKVWTYLSNNGPATFGELPSDKITNAVKDDGIRKFSPRNRASGGAINAGGQKTSVYYIEGKHNPATVVRKWLSENKRVVEDGSTWATHHMISVYGDSFKNASREILGPFDVGQIAQDGGAGGTCPFCGEEYPLHLPGHLENCEKA